MGERFHIEISRPEDIIPRLGKGIFHWRAGRSAAELANTWWKAQGIPNAVRSVIEQCEEWRGANILDAFFERQTDLGTRGRPSQTDLLVLSSGPHGRGIIGVEGKVDEPFGQRVEEWRHTDPSPEKERRLETLCKLLRLDAKRATDLRYQLLHRTAAAMIEADRFECRHVLVLVHHFTPDSKEHSPNFSDFSQFTTEMGAPVPNRNAASEAIRLDDHNLRFAWVDDRPAPKLLSARDLVVALGWQCQLKDVENELARYWRLRFAKLSSALGLPTNWQDDRTRTPHLASELAQEACNAGFFAQFLEYTPLTGEKKIIDRYKPQIRTAETALSARLIDCAEELLTTAWPEIRRKTVSDEHLVAMGVPAERPDPVDYL